MRAHSLVGFRHSTVERSSHVVVFDSVKIPHERLLRQELYYCRRGHRCRCSTTKAEQRWCGPRHSARLPHRDISVQIDSAIFNSVDYPCCPHFSMISRVSLSFWVHVHPAWAVLPHTHVLCSPAYGVRVRSQIHAHCISIVVDAAARSVLVCRRSAMCYFAM